MAKPLSVASNVGAGSSTSIASGSTHRTTATTKQQRRRKPTAAKSHLAPSPALLSFLATVASATVAEGSPAPPAFLCPSIASTPVPASTKARRVAPESAVKPRSVPQSRAVVQNIPHRFEQGEDGVWRRIDSYTLYGICPNCAPSLDGQISKNTTMTNTTTTKHDTLDNLPPGWSPISKPYQSGHTTLILAMSLVLAFFICFLIIGCLFWRKSMRRKYNEKDLEKKGRGRSRRNGALNLSAEEAREAHLEKDSKVKQKLWARATARWKANARHSARQRRGKRLFSAARGRQSTTSLNNSRDDHSTHESSPSRTPAYSRSLSRRSSLSSLPREPVNSNFDRYSPTDNVPIPTIAFLAPEPSASPPAYQQKSDHTPQMESSEGLYVPTNCTSTSQHSRSRRPSHSSIMLSPSSDTPGEPPPSPALRAAHVATDDKTVLARLAELASAPPTPESTSAPEVSAPEWRDEELEEFMALQELSDDTTSRSLTAPSSPFPPPPPKAQLLEPNFYKYPYSFEDISNLEPEYGPSAPPFEETPGAPLGGVVPSAPPLIDDDDVYMPDSIPTASAPPAGLVLAHNQNGEGGSEYQDLPTHDIEAESNDTRNPASSPFDNESRGDLPGYRP